MALRLPFPPARLLVALMLVPAAASAARVPAEPGVDAAGVPTSWTERVRIRSGAGTGPTLHRPPDLALRIVTPQDSERGYTPQDPVHDNRPGRVVGGPPSPAIAVMPAMAGALVADHFQDFPDALPAEGSTLHFMAREWALIQLGDTPEYRLDHLSFVEQRRADGTFVDAVSCSDGDRSATLDQWQANDYAMVRQASQVIAEACVGRLATRMPAFYPSALAREALGADADGAVPPARVRIFGAAGRGITMYTDTTCSETYRDVIEVSRSNFRALGGLFGGAPENIAIGIPETDTVRNMKSVLFSMPNYEEYEVPGGKPLLFEARVENTADYRCARTLSAWFVGTPGQDYEVEMDVADRMCRLRIRQVQADGSLTPQPLRPGQGRCDQPGRAPGAGSPEQGPPSLP